MNQSGTVGQVTIGPVGPLAQSGQSGNQSNLGSQLASRLLCQTKLSHGQSSNRARLSIGPVGQMPQSGESGPVVDRASRANAPIGRVGPSWRSGQSGKCPNRASREVRPIWRHGQDAKVSVRCSEVSSDVKARQFTRNIKTRLASTMLFSKNGLRSARPLIIPRLGSAWLARARF